MVICAVEGCDRPKYKRVWCNSHYIRWRRYGDPLASAPRPKAVERFMVFVNKDTNGCWLWTGYLDSNGYGRFTNGRSAAGKLAHRFSYEAFVASIPDGLTLDHLCRRPACVNPAHLAPVTNKVNVLRGTGPSAIHAEQTHCIHGHEFTAANTYMTKRGSRMCRICNARRQRATQARRRGMTA